MSLFWTCQEPRSAVDAAREMHEPLDITPSSRKVVIDLGKDSKPAVPLRDCFGLGPDGYFGFFWHCP